MLGHSGSLSKNEYKKGQSCRARLSQQSRAALYLRVSTPDQKPDLQYDGLRTYAERANLQIVGEYCDVAVSGCREGRPQLNALMTSARTYEFDCVLVWKFNPKFSSWSLTPASLGRFFSRNINPLKIDCSPKAPHQMGKPFLNFPRTVIVSTSTTYSNSASP